MSGSRRKVRAKVKTLLFTRILVKDGTDAGLAHVFLRCLFNERPGT
jgi:hypothetical protein